MHKGDTSYKVEIPKDLKNKITKQAKNDGMSNRDKTIIDICKANGWKIKKSWKVGVGRWGKDIDHLISELPKDLK